MADSQSEQSPDRAPRRLECAGGHHAEREREKLLLGWWHRDSPEHIRTIGCHGRVEKFGERRLLLDACAGTQQSLDCFHTGVLDSILRRDRFRRVAGIYKPPSPNHSRLHRESLGGRSGHASFVLHDALAGRDSDLQQLFRAETLLSHRDADFSSCSTFLDPECHPAHRCDGGPPCRAIPYHLASLDLCPFNGPRAVPVRRKFCELSRHTQDSLAGYGIRIDWPGANENSPVVRFSIAGG